MVNGMKKSILSVLALALLQTGTAFAQEAAPEKKSGKPFKRALVLAGGGFQTPIFLGILEAALTDPDPAKRPDVVIATCGGSVASAIANAIPDAKERKEFLMGEGYFNFLHSLKIDHGGIKDLVGAFFRLRGQANQKPGDWRIPRVFDNIMMDIPQTKDAMPVLDREFNPYGVPIILVAGETTFSPKDIVNGKGRKVLKGEKLFTEVYFTDEKTAEHLKGLKSATSRPDNLINLETKTITGKKLFQASRASISDFYGTSLMQIDGKYFVTGAINLYPAEVAKYVADEVIMTYKRAFNPLFDTAMRGIFRYNTNERLREVHKAGVDHWVDITDANLLEKDEFGIKMVKISKFLPIKAKVKLDIPDDYQEYQRRFSLLFDYGKKRGEEALAQTVKNDKCAIRQLTSGNTDFSDPAFDKCPERRPNYKPGNKVFESLRDAGGEAQVQALGNWAPVDELDFVGGEVKRESKNGEDTESFRLACVGRSTMTGKCSLVQFVQVQKNDEGQEIAIPLEADRVFAFADDAKKSVRKNIGLEYWSLTNNWSDNVVPKLPGGGLLIVSAVIPFAGDLILRGPKAIMFNALAKPAAIKALNVLFKDKESKTLRDKDFYKLRSAIFAAGKTADGTTAVDISQ